MNNNGINLMKIDYIEFYVANLFQACHFYENTMGFARIGYRECKESPEQSISILLKQNDIYIILTTSLSPDSAISLHIHKHGDGIKDIAFSTNDATACFTKAVNDGANIISPPTVLEDKNCKLVKATISTFGDTQHSFIERDKTSRNFLPAFELYNEVGNSSELGLQLIDHVAVCVQQGSLLKWKEFYTNVLGFHQFHQEQVYTNHSGMNSFALYNSKKSPSFSIVLVEPINGIKKSQVQEFIDHYGSDGVQHLAFLSSDIFHSIHAMRENKIPFLSIPKSYYDELPKQLVKLKANFHKLQELQILVDQDENGDLYQAFSKTIQSRPTFFIEIIQRQGAKGFGSRNIKKLFEAVERERAKDVCSN